MSGNSSASRAVPYDPSLLQPIVRSKRTPIACTECRRRQVKCSGGTPRCERCHKKNIECTYVSLSEQRAVSTTPGGGSISRTGTPVAQVAHQHLAGHHGHGAPMHGSSRLAHPSTQAQWAAGMQGYVAGSTHPASHGWRPQSPAVGGPTSQYRSQGAQENQSYTGVPMAYPQGFAQQAAYGQENNASQGGGDMFAQGYAQQQGYASGASYNAYGQGLPTTDPRYAYQAAQMAAMTGGSQQNAAYVNQMAQQMYFDPVAGQMIPADVASQWSDNTNAGFQGQPYSGRS